MKIFANIFNLGIFSLYVCLYELVKWAINLTLVQEILDE